MLRIAHVGLGPLGRLIVEDMCARGVGRAVAAVDTDPDIAGRDLGQLVRGVGEGVKVATDLSGIDPDGVDCAIVATASDLRRCERTIAAVVERGVSVVSTCEELLYPWLRHPELARGLHDLAVRRGARVLGTGVNPGFLMDTLPVVLSAVCRDVRAVRVERVQDASSRRVPFQRKIGATLDEAGFRERVAEGSLRHVGLGESLHFVASCLGLEVGAWDERIEPVIAGRDLECGLGAIPRGRVSGVRQVAVGHDREGREVVALEFVAAIGQEEPRDRVVIEGDPALDVTIAGGVHGDTATSSVVLNSIPSLLGAPAGLHTMADIAPARFRRGGA